LIAECDVTPVNNHVGVAIIALLFVPVAKSVPDLVTDSAAIPGGRPKFYELLAARHSN